MRGYWQSYLHFANYTNELREHIFVAKQSVLEKVAKFFLDLYQRKFTFIPQFSLENHQSLKKQLAQSNHTTWIGIHVRRFDFVQYKAASSDEYLFNAIEYYTRRYPNAHFLVASDDKSYCKKLFHDRSNIFLTPQSFSAGDDFITLSLCQHSIITGGTFGWWTTYLANGEVVHDTVYATTCEKDEYYYPSWFKTDLDIILDKHTS
jgi:galactoside 2-L-fucosyltransferase 1/2